MKIFGIILRKPNFNQLTLSAIGCTLLLLVVLGFCKLFGYQPDETSTRVVAVSLAWGTLCNLMGIRALSEVRQLLFTVCGCAVVNFLATATVAALAS